MIQSVFLKVYPQSVDDDGGRMVDQSVFTLLSLMKIIYLWFVILDMKKQKRNKKPINSCNYAAMAASFFPSLPQHFKPTPISRFPQVSFSFKVFPSQTSADAGKQRKEASRLQSVNQKLTAD